MGDNCIPDPCRKRGTFSSDSDCCSGYVCMDGEIVRAVGQNCQSDASYVSGRVCDTDLPTCYYETGKLRVTYKPFVYGCEHTTVCERMDLKCESHTDCDMGLYCHGSGFDPNSNGFCNVCKKLSCPEKRPLSQTCKYGDYGCPNKCAIEGKKVSF